MTEAYSSLLTGLVSGAITAVITYFVTLSKARLELTIEYDKELRQNRLEAYQKLWKIMKPLARYSAERPLTHQIVKQTSEAMRDWYFDAGGIFLSRASLTSPSNKRCRRSSTIPACKKQRTRRWKRN